MAENDFPAQKGGSPVVLPSTTLQPSETSKNLQHIQVNNISGPLVVFYGPRNIGKTVTLLRLCTHISKYDIRPDETFRADQADYKNTIESFETVRADMQFAPSATGNINFLLLNVTYNGNKFCQVLEAPGEHYFDEENPNKDYPAYLNQIINADYKKVYVFFFALDMFKKDQDKVNYTNKIAKLVSERVHSKKDRVIIICNKSDLQAFMRDGKPIESEYRKALYNHDAFKRLTDTLKKGGFGKIPFIPFSAGSFNDDGAGRLVYALSGEQYPQRLWQEIHDCIEGKPWWKFW